MGKKYNKNSHVIIFQISESIIHTVIFILSFIILCLYPFNEKNYTNLIKENWKINPITKIEIEDKDSSSSEKIDLNGEKDIKIGMGKV